VLVCKVDDVGWLVHALRQVPYQEVFAHVNGKELAQPGHVLAAARRARQDRLVLLFFVVSHCFVLDHVVVEVQ